MGILRHWRDLFAGAMILPALIELLASCLRILPTIENRLAHFASLLFSRFLLPGLGFFQRFEFALVGGL